MYLRQMLYRCDIKFLPIIAGYWLKLQRTPNYEELIRMLCEKMLNPDILRTRLSETGRKDFLPPLQYLSENQGIVPVESFEELFGTFRVAGIDKILREKLWESPVSLTEELWYRGFIYRENQLINGELKDCYILPEDLLKKINGIIPYQVFTTQPAPTLTVRPAVASETAWAIPQEDNLPDLFCLFAGLQRDGKVLNLPGYNISPSHQRFMEMLLREGEFFQKGKDADTEKIRLILTQNRIAAKLQMIRIWRNAGHYDELLENRDDLNVLIPPEHDSRTVREKILNYLTSLPVGTWWSLNGFIEAVKKTDPMFLRQSFGEERWQILDTQGNDLNGMSSWYQLEGAYLRFLLFGPLTWLGIIQASSPSRNDLTPTAFRISSDGLFYLTESGQAEAAPEILAKPNLEHGTPTISADGAITCSRDVPRYFRYMAARFCVIEKYKANVCTFRITPGSLNGAEQAGISRDAILSTLKRFSGKAIPPTLERMLSTVNKKTLPATIYQAIILTVPDQQMIKKILETSRLEKWVMQQLNTNSLLIDPKGIDDIRRFLMENEIFVDIQFS